MNGSDLGWYFREEDGERQLGIGFWGSGKTVTGMLLPMRVDGSQETMRVEFPEGFHCETGKYYVAWLNTSDGTFRELKENTPNVTM